MMAAGTLEGFGGGAASCLDAGLLSSSGWGASSSGVWPVRRFWLTPSWRTSVLAQSEAPEMLGVMGSSADPAGVRGFGSTIRCPARLRCPETCPTRQPRSSLTYQTRARSA